MASVVAPVQSAGKTVAQAGEVRVARVESLRAIAALGVLIGHVWLLGRIAAGHGLAIQDTFLHRFVLSGGFGLSLFFGLSGYLIYWPFAQRGFGGGGAVDLRVYARNRAYRILPLYYAILVIVMLAQEHGGTFSQWWRFSVFFENFSTKTVGTVDGPMWSLVVELHFYLLLPLIAIVVERISRGDRRIGAGLIAGAALIAFGLHWRYVANASVVDLRKEYSLPTQFGFFCGGMLIAVLRTAWREKPPRILSGPVGRSDLWLLASIPLWLIAVNDYRFVAINAVASALMIGACVLPLRPGPLLRALDQRWLVAAGVISYSIYLIHFPLLSALDDHLHSVLSLGVVALPVTVAIAWISYRVIEEPFLKRRKRWSQSAAAHAPTS